MKPKPIIFIKTPIETDMGNLNNILSKFSDEYHILVACEDVQGITIQVFYENSSEWYIYRFIGTIF